MNNSKIGKIVRKAIKEAGGTMPENLHTSRKSLEQLEKENKKSLKNIEIKVVLKFLLFTIN